MEKKKREYKMQLDLTTTYGKVMAWAVGPIFYLTLLQAAYNYRGIGAVAFLLAVTVFVSYRPVKNFLASRQAPKK